MPADWYASPTGSGNGSLASPWALQTAMTSGNGQAAGDTIYLREGTYTGLGYRCNLVGASNNYIVIRSYPGEWATITDGITATLGTAMSSAAGGASTSGVVITNSENAVAGQVIIIGSEHMQLNAKTGANVWTVVRGWNGTTPAAHSQGDGVIFANNIIDHTGSYVRFQDFAITSQRSTNRVTGDSNALGTGLNLDTGVGNKAVNLVIYNTGHPGIGFWDQGGYGEINGCVIYGVGMYDDEGTWIRGNGIYSQNVGGMATIENIISHHNFTGGAQVFGETGPVRDFQFVNNIAMMNGEYHQLRGYSGSTSTSNIWFTGNTVLGGLGLVYVSTGNKAQYVHNNLLVRGTIWTEEHVDSSYTNNVIFMAQSASSPQNTTQENGYRSTLLSSNSLNIVWDYNTWYQSNATASTFLRFGSTEGLSAWQNLAGFRSLTGWDVNGTSATSWPSSYLNVKVQQTDYDPNRWNIVVVATDAPASTTLNLSTQCGFVSGQRYRLRDAQNYFSPLATATYTGGTITLPLTQTNLATITGSITNMTVKHSNVDYPGLFNAFVLERLSGPAVITTTLKAGSIKGIP